MIALTLLALLQQQPTTARLEIIPAQPEVQVGGSLQLAARLVDQNGVPVSGARVLWFGGGFNGTIDSTGLVRGGYRGKVHVVAIATAPGTKRVTTNVAVRVLPG